MRRLTLGEAPLDGQKRLDNTALDELLSITDDKYQESERDDLLTPLYEATAVSLFVLSREALSSKVRSEAAIALDARLREGAESVPPSNSAAPQELPPELASHRHFYKFCEDRQWMLTTRGGIRVATFASEAELDQWWRGLRWQRGRILTTRRAKTPHDPEPAEER